MPSARDDDLLRIAQHITDDHDVDWDDAESRRSSLGSTLDGLRILEQVARAHRDVRGADPLEDVFEGDELFRWGPLRVVEQIGAGGFGEVYRAWDPRLERMVALKLRKRTSAGPELPTSWLEEGRKLARVRHPHVVAVHGADVHDDRAGLWMDFLRGRTLEEQLREAGTLGAGEASAIGVDLCSALAAVHAAGLVHGDVKTPNVMREEGGRVVLMDFGSVHERGREEEGRPPSITPLATAPEVLAGGPLSVEADIYSVGALLYRLTTGRYPVEAPTLPELLRQHRERGTTPLRDLRPDLPADFVAVVERALSADPVARFGSVGELERVLSGQREAPAPAAAPPRRTPWIWAVAAVLVVAIGIAVLRPDGPSVDPTAPPQLTATLLRTGAADREPLADGASLAPGDRLTLEVRTPEPVHLYVLNEDDAGRVYVLFPLPGQALENPLAAGVPHRIPSAPDGRPLEWVVTSAGGRERFLTIASRDPLETLEVRLATLQTADRDRPTMASQLAMGEIRELLRGVGGLADAEAAPASGEVLRSIAAGLGDRRDVWMRLQELRNP